MASVNRKTVAPVKHTHNGAVASRISPFLELRRTVMATLLWENSFYESGASVEDRIKNLIPKCEPEKVAQLAIDTRVLGNLRHVPLLIVREMARLPSHRHLVAETLFQVIRRADELAEFVAIYWKDGKQPLSAQVKKGLAKAFTKFNEYALAKYNREKDVTLRDVLFLCHARPINNEQATLWKKLINDELAVPDTWEVELSKSKDKNASWSRLVSEKKLGGLATLRNIRNMEQASLSKKTIEGAIAQANYDNVLPFRFIAAARVASQYESALEEAMFRVTSKLDRLPGRTAIVVDISGSMFSALSQKSDMQRFDAAAGVAMIAREICEDVCVYSFSGSEKLVAPRRGFALRDAISSSQHHGGTDVGNSVRGILSKEKNLDRIIVITDEQSHTRVMDPNVKHAYMVNVANYQNGIGYGKWTQIDGFSESIIKFISEFEKFENT